LAFLGYSAAQSLRQHKGYFEFSLWPVAVMLVVYGLSFLLPIPSIIRTAIALVTVSMVIYGLFFGKHPPLSFWPLIVISLPVVPSLQFYLGYPARYISASLTVPLLQMQGLAVTQSGTNLVWQNQMLQFDAPCSGVTMLWAVVGCFGRVFIRMVVFCCC
jgi:hypothetical protein